MGPLRNFNSVAIIDSRDILFKTKGCSKTIQRPSLYGTSFGALESIMATLLEFFLKKKQRYFSKLKVVVRPQWPCLYGKSCGALESILPSLLKFWPNKNSLKKRGDIFFKTKGCSQTIQRPCLCGTSFGALDSTMATLLKLLLNTNSSKNKEIYFSKQKVVVRPYRGLAYMEQVLGLSSQ